MEMTVLASLHPMLSSNKVTVYSISKILEMYAALEMLGLFAL